MDFLNAGPWLASFWLHSRRAKGNANSNTFMIYTNILMVHFKGKILNFGKTFYFSGCIFVLTNVSRPCWWKNGDRQVLWCCECHSFSTSKNSTLQILFFFFLFEKFTFKYKLCVSYIIHFTYLTLLGLMILKCITLILDFLLIPIQSSNGGFLAWEP